MSRARVAIVGGGAWVPALCEALARARGIPALHVCLSARRPERLRVIAGYAAQHVPALEVEACSTLEAAVAGADAVILLVRIGGLAARAHDEEFPRAFGLAGDEGLGVGGIANAWRTLPVLGGIAATIVSHAPGARILNLMAPLGITTRLLVEAGLDAVGLCELPTLTERALAGHVGGGLHYGGLNHLGWFWSDRPARLRPAVDLGLVDATVLDRYGAIPLPYFYDVFEPEVARRLARRREPRRAERLMALSDRLIERFAADGDAPELHARRTPWFEDAVAPVLGAGLGAPACHGFADVRNGSLVPELPADLVVETRVTVDAAGVHPERPGPLPDAVARFLGAVGRADDVTYRAARERDRALLASAVTALPLPISPSDVPRLVAEASRQHEERFP